MNFLYALTPSVQFITSGGWDYRSYSQSRERDGGYGYAGEYLRLFFGQDNHEFLLGGRFLWGDADFDDYSYEGWEGSARFLFRLPRGFEFAPFVSVTHEFYHGPATALETGKRDDTRLRLGAALTWRLTENWALETSYQYTANSSESVLYDYKQHLVTTGIAWSF
jgi:opacity protein-like surface antigen